MGQDYDKDLYLMITGSGNTTRPNWEDNVEDFIFGDREAREVTLVVPYVQELGKGMDTILNQWAVGNDRQNPNYPIVGFVEPEGGHRSVASAQETFQLTDEHGEYANSAAVEKAMEFLVGKKKEGNEVAVVVIYDETKDVHLVGDIKNYDDVPVYNVDGMIDSFPGFKTTAEILKEEREREEFETKEKIRLAAEREQEAAQKDPESPLKTARAPRKRAAKKVAAPEEKPLTARKTAAKKTAPPKPVEELQKEAVEGKVEESSELPKELEPVKELTDKPVGVVPAMLPPKTEEVPDLWKDVSQAQAAVDKGEVTHYAVSKENLASLSEGITEMAQSFAKVMDSMTKIIEGK